MSVKMFNGCWVRTNKDGILGPYHYQEEGVYPGRHWIPDGKGVAWGLDDNGHFLSDGQIDEEDDAVEVYASDPREVSIAPGDDVSFMKSYTVESRGYHITSRDGRITLHVHGGGIVFNGGFQLCKDRANEFMAMMNEAMRLCEQHGWM